MKSLNAIIIDDEENNRENLRLALEQHCPEVSAIGEAESVMTAIDKITELNPDLVFLDIAMPIGDGFQLLESLPKIDFDVIFVTAYDHYAIKAIRFSAIDYLLKPIDALELKQAVGRVLHKRDKKQKTKNLDMFLSNLRQKEKKIALPQLDHVEFVPVADIIRCQGDKNYTYFFLKDGRKILVSRTLKEYVELLEDSDFYRVHQSHLVNLNFVQKYGKRDGGFVIMNDNHQIPVARNRKEALLRLLMQRF